MALLHQRVIEKHVKHIQGIPHNHAEMLGKWSENLDRGIYDSETQNDSEFIQRILIDVLGYIGSSEGKSWTVAKNQPLPKGNVDVALGEFTADKTKIIAPFELKGAKTKDLDAVMAGRNKTPVQQAWEYANDIKGAQWVLVSNYREIRLYAVGYGRKDYESFDLTKLTDPAQYSRFILLLSAQNLLSGKTLSFLKESEQVEKDITDQLYADYRTLRRRLIDTISKDNPDKDPLDVIRYTQTILDRILFVAFAEDKGLLPERTLEKAYETQNLFSPQPVWENFKGLFQAINKGNAALNIPGYNGGLFADDLELNSLNISNDLCEGFKKIGEYDFDSDVSVNILGHIFEQSIADLEELKAQAEGTETEFDKKKSKRKKDGIFYTPPYITRYIVEQAVGCWLADKRKEIGFDKLPVLTDSDFDSIKITGKRKLKREHNKNIAEHIAAWEAYKKVLSNIKVLDPACGSGAFLNEVFDYLKNEGQTINNELARLTGDQTDLFRWDTHILANNIFGVDLNRESVEITKLSLWLKTANRNEKLTYLENNIKVGNSLIDDPAIAGDLAFDWHKEFSTIMTAGGFDVVVGNPPYTYRNAIREQDKEYYKKVYKSSEGNFDLYKFFMEKSGKVLCQQGFVSFIVPNTFLSAQTYAQLRKIILENYHIVELFDLGLNVFENVVVENIIFLFKKTAEKGLTQIKVQRDRVRHINDYQQQYNVNLIDKNNATENEFNINVSPLFEPVIERMEANSVPLSTMAYCTVGINTGYIKSDLTSNTKIDHRYHKVLNGKDISRHTFEWPGEWIMYDPDFVKSKGTLGRTLPPDYIFLRPKILLQRTRRGMKRKLIAYLDKENFFNLNRLSNVVVQDELYSVEYIYCLINSNLMDFYFNVKFNEYEVKPLHLNRLPIKALSPQEQNVFVDKAEYILKAAADLKALRIQFLNLLKTEFGIEKINTKLETWFSMDFSDFSQTLSSYKIKLSLQQKSEWMQHFEAEKAKALALKAEFDRLDAEIDQMVYALYGLTPDEIAIVEGAA